MAVRADKFKESKRLTRDGRQIVLRGKLPGEGAAKGDFVNVRVIAKDSVHRKQIMLERKLAEGGEGSVFTTSLDGYVAKIYRRDRLTTDRQEKLTRMISTKIECEGVCFPEALILNDQEEFVGYLMAEASGHELGKSVFQPKLLLQKFPNWTKRDTVDLSMTILRKIKYLNERNVILGDINPANILVQSPAKVYFVDCDSYQVEGYPCPVGTANFTPPEVQGRDYKTFLRTQEMENFAIATLLFMIMLPGKPPYSAVGGASPETNIREGVFPYPHKDTETDRTPPGKWGYIWSHMSYKMRLAFYETFKKGEKHFAPENRYNAEEWLEQFKDYRYALDLMVKNDPLAMAIFPTREKMKECKDCGERYVPDRNNYTPYCPKRDAKHGGSTRAATKSAYGGSSYGGITARGYSSRPQTANQKLCPYCNRNHIPPAWRYCKSCKDKVLRQRECVNCHENFPVTVSLEVWEKEHNATRKQCDTCRAAGCTADPCRHAKKKPATTSASTTKIGTAKTATKKSATATTKPSSSGIVSWKKVVGGFVLGVLIGWFASPLTWGLLYLLIKAVTPNGLNLGGDAVGIFFGGYFILCGIIGSYVHSKRE